uniref:Uncharacterized protein n=1 Tax=Amphimedon queenslandica TaxID=400682 RepID=A0A1X7U2H9_AMPQE
MPSCHVANSNLWQTEQENLPDGKRQRYFRLAKALVYENLDEQSTVLKWPSNTTKKPQLLLSENEHIIFSRQWVIDDFIMLHKIS